MLCNKIFGTVSKFKCLVERLRNRNKVTMKLEEEEILEGSVIN
jgi:hypothetical protein